MIKKHDAIAPSDNVVHILEVTWDENKPTIKVTIVKIEPLVKMVWRDLL